MTDLRILERDGSAVVSTVPVRHRSGAGGAGISLADFAIARTGLIIEALDQAGAVLARSSVKSLEFFDNVRSPLHPLLLNDPISVTRTGEVTDRLHLGEAVVPARDVGNARTHVWAGLGSADLIRPTPARCALLELRRDRVGVDGDYRCIAKAELRPDSMVVARAEWVRGMP